MKFYSEGEKIKSLRNQLGLNQEDLQDEHISRGLISMIETNKRELTYTVASSLADKFNDKAEKLGLALNITEEYLTRTEKGEAESYCLSKLKIDDLTKEQFHEIFEIAKQYDLPHVEARAYLVLGDENLKSKSYDDACSYYDKSIKLYKKLYLNGELAYIYYKIGVTNAISFHYESALVYFNLSQYYGLIYDDKETRKLALNDLARVYVYLNKFKLALETIDKCLKITKENDNLYAKVLNTKAICYSELNKCTKANDIYKGLVNLYLNANKKGVFLGCIYTNLGVNYCNLKDFEESLKYFEKAEKFRIEVDQSRLCRTILEKANVYIKQKFYDKAIETLKESLKYAEKYNELEYLLRGHNMLKDLYIELNDCKNLENEYLELIKLLKINNDEINLKVIYDKLRLLYLKQDKANIAIKYISLSELFKTIE